LKATLKLGRLKGFQNREMIVHSNDPDMPQFKLSFVGNAYSRAKVDPDRVDVGTVEGSEPVSKTFKVTAERGLTFNIVDARTSGQSVAADFKVVKPGKEYNVTVTLMPPIEKNFHGWIHLLTDNDKQYHTIGIPVFANVPGKAATGRRNQSAAKNGTTSSEVLARAPSTK
jgi:hypothetical protein